MGQKATQMRQPTAETGQPTYRRAHGTQLVVASRKGKVVPIPCPRCRRRAAERFWHVDLETGICDRCWRDLADKRIPMAL